ncbi:NADH-dependent flavin oxidoreductase [Mesomycoplasma ovipneumoniae]|uniref:NADH-dependent flavin oxidoreductase n=1 Tax=Mesomycoplasma ovipneumoniae TaxID=29562 RepID=UPI00311AF3B5
MKNKLFKPYQIGNFTLKNRFVFSPINLNLSENGQVCQADLDFFSARAHSAPMTITGGVYVCKSGSLFKYGHSIENDSDIEGLAKLAKAIKSKGSIAILQLIHAGSHSVSKIEKDGFCYGPSAEKRNYPVKYKVFRLTQKQIQKIVNQYADACLRAIKAGFDGVEISSAQKLLPQEFFSHYTNKRNDKYGCQNIENRSRFLVEILEKVQKTILKSKNPNFLLGYRATPEERRGDNLGYTVENFLDFLDLIEKRGIKISYLAIAGWGFDVFRDKVRSKSNNFNRLISDVVYEKLQGKIPVIASGSINSLEKSVEAIQFSDFVGISSAFVPDPDFVEKIEKNQPIKLSLEPDEFEKLKISKNVFKEIGHYFEYGKSLPENARKTILNNSKKVE